MVKRRRFKSYIAGAIIAGLILAGLGIIPFGFAEKFESAENGFWVNLPGGWVQKPAAYAGVLVSYFLQGTEATLNISVRDVQGGKKVEDLSWEELFSPQYEAIDIRTEGLTFLDGVKAKYCIYTIRPGPLKAQMEGKLSLKYLNYILIVGPKLYSVTFTDTELGFSSDYRDFLEVLRTFKFVKSALQHSTEPVKS